MFRAGDWFRISQQPDDSLSDTTSDFESDVDVTPDILKSTEVAIPSVKFEVSTPMSLPITQIPSPPSRNAFEVTPEPEDQCYGRKGSSRKRRASSSDSEYLPSDDDVLGSEDDDILDSEDDDREQLVGKNKADRTRSQGVVTCTPSSRPKVASTATSNILSQPTTLRCPPRKLQESPNHGGSFLKTKPLNSNVSSRKKEVPSKRKACEIEDQAPKTGRDCKDFPKQKLLKSEVRPSEQVKRLRIYNMIRVEAARLLNDKEAIGVGLDEEKFKPYLRAALKIALREYKQDKKAVKVEAAEEELGLWDIF